MRDPRMKSHLETGEAWPPPEATEGVDFAKLRADPLMDEDAILDPVAIVRTLSAWRAEHTLDGD